MTALLELLAIIGLAVLLGLVLLLAAAIGNEKVIAAICSIYCALIAMLTVTLITR